MTIAITRADLNELTTFFEDAVSYCCDEQVLSGQAAWTVLHVLAQAKLREFDLHQ